MPNVKYVGSTVNSAANELTTVAGRFQPVSSSVQTKTGVMIGCKGFNTIAQATSSSYSSNIDMCEKQVAGIGCVCLDGKSDNFVTLYNILI